MRWLFAAGDSCPVSFWSLLACAVATPPIWNTISGRLIHRRKLGNIRSVHLYENPMVQWSSDHWCKCSGIRFSTIARAVRIFVLQAFSNVAVCSLASRLSFDPSIWVVHWHRGYPSTHRSGFYLRSIIWIWLFKNTKQVTYAQLYWRSISSESVKNWCPVFLFGG